MLLLGRLLQSTACCLGAPADVFGEARPEGVPGDLLLAPEAAPPEQAHLRLPDQAVRPLMVVGLRPLCLRRQLLRQVHVGPLQPSTIIQLDAMGCERSRQGASRGCRCLPSPAPVFCQVHVCHAQLGSTSPHSLALCRKISHRRPSSCDVVQRCRKQASHVQLEPLHAPASIARAWALGVTLLLRTSIGTLLVRKETGQYLRDCWLNRMQRKPRGVASPGHEGLEAAR